MKNSDNVFEAIQKKAVHGFYQKYGTMRTKSHKNPQVGKFNSHYLFMIRWIVFLSANEYISPKIKP